MITSEEKLLSVDRFTLDIEIPRTIQAEIRTLSSEAYKELYNEEYNRLARKMIDGELSPEFINGWKACADYRIQLINKYKQSFNKK